MSLIGQVIFYSLVGDLVLFGVLLLILISIEGDKLVGRLRKARLAKQVSDMIDKALMNGSLSINEYRGKLDPHAPADPANPPEGWHFDADSWRQT